jgi:RNA polymerase sigma-70 factor (ECF subfamily)
MSSDETLLAAWRAGDRAAGATLLRRHIASVAGFFRTKVDGNVDDLVQRTFLACIESPERIPEGVGLRAWLLGIARNLLFNHFRKGEREERAMARDAAAGDPTMPTPSVAAAVREEQRLVLHALRSLPLDLQIAIELQYWEQLGTDEIAAVLDIPRGTVKSRLFRARAELKAAIERLAPSAALRTSTASDLDRWAKSLAAWARAPDGEDGD